MADCRLVAIGCQERVDGREIRTRGAGQPTNTADEVEEVVAQSDGSYLIDGAATIREINKATEWTLPTDVPKTLNGLALEQLESIPDGNVSFIVSSYRCETIELNGKMIKKICVIPLKNEKEEE